jgi:hypothetical protein
MFLLVSRFIFIFILYYILGCLLSHTHHMCRVVLCCVVLCCVVWLDLKPNTYIQYDLISINSFMRGSRAFLTNINSDLPAFLTCLSFKYHAFYFCHH